MYVYLIKLICRLTILEIGELASIIGELASIIGELASIIGELASIIGELASMKLKCLMF